VLKSLIISVAVLHSGFAQDIPDQAMTRIESCVRSHVRADAESVAIEIRSPMPDFVSSDSGCDFEVVDPGTQPIKGNMNIAVDVHTAGGAERRVYVPLRIQTYSQLILTSRQLDRHAVIGEGDIRRQWVETTSLPEDVCLASADVIGQRTKKLINPGNVLLRRWIESAPIILQRSVVTLVACGPSFRLSSKAVAMEDGRAGEPILVQKIGSNTKLKARVLDSSTVQMDIGE